MQPNRQSLRHISRRSVAPVLAAVLAVSAGVGLASGAIPLTEDVSHACFAESGGGLAVAHPQIGDCESLDKPRRPGR